MGERMASMVAIRASREGVSAASMAMMRPRDWVWWRGKGGMAGEREWESGGEILERTRILPMVGMERIIASRDLACVSMFMLLLLLLLLVPLLLLLLLDCGFCNGARVREFSG